MTGPANRGFQPQGPAEPSPDLETPAVRKRRVPYALIFAALLVAVLGWAVLHGGDPGVVESPLVGKPAPDFTSVRLESRTLAPYGEKLSLADLRGRPVAVNFWASWCIPCREEAPLLVAAQQQYARDGFVFVGVSYNDNPAAAKAFAREYGYNFPLVTDLEGKIAVDYGVTGIPETFFIDRDGTVIKKQIGPFKDQADLNRWIERIR